MAHAHNLFVLGGYPGNTYTARFGVALKEKFGIALATIQIESEPGTPCKLEFYKSI